MKIGHMGNRKEVAIDLGIHDVELTEMRPTADGRGKICTVVGTKKGHVILRIDTSRLGEYCRKAVRSKSGKSVLASGAFVFVQADRCPKMPARQKVGAS